MQLMPGTASQLGVDNAFDAAKNTDGGTRYLRMLLERFNFDVAKALAAYNAGPLRVDQHNGVPPYLETRKYVARIINDYNRKKLAQEKSTAGKTATAKAKPPVTSLKPAAKAKPSAKSSTVTKQKPFINNKLKALGRVDHADGVLYLGRGGLAPTGPPPSCFRQR